MNDRPWRRRRHTDDELLTFVATWTRVHGYPPSVREMCEGLGYKSTESVHRRLCALRDAGRVQWRDGQTRTLTIVESS